MTLGPAKHEKEAMKLRISNVFRIVKAHSAKQSVDIISSKGHVIHACMNKRDFGTRKT